MDEETGMPRNSGLWGTSLVSLCFVLVKHFCSVYVGYEGANELVDLGRYASPVYCRNLPLCWNGGCYS
jgi:hypothetical protein